MSSSGQRHADRDGPVLGGHHGPGGATLDAGTATWSGYADMACGIGVGGSTITAGDNGDANFNGSQSAASLFGDEPEFHGEGTFCLFVGDDSGSARRNCGQSGGNTVHGARSTVGARAPPTSLTLLATVTTSRFSTSAPIRLSWPVRRCGAIRQARQARTMTGTPP